MIGAGPMGALFAMLAKAHGAARVFIIDVVPYRLDFAANTLGVMPINGQQQDAAAVIRAATGLAATW